MVKVVVMGGRTTFADAIRVARAARRWSQAELAQRLGVSEDRVWRLEHGARLGIEERHRLTDLLGLHIESAGPQ